jgi:hypothetical protein
MTVAQIIAVGVIVVYAAVFGRIGWELYKEEREWERVETWEADND